MSYISNREKEHYIYKATLTEREGPYNSIRPYFLGHSLCPNGHIYGPLRRKRFVFQYILSGSGTFESPYGIFSPSAGDMIIMHRGDLVDYGCYDGEPWEAIWIEFDCNETLPKVFNSGLIHNEELKEIFLDMKKIKNMSHGQTAYICSCIWRIIALLDTDESTQKHYSPYVNEAIKIIKEYYIQKITVTNLAKKLNLNRSYFCSLFKKEVGIPPKEYIDEYRISASCEILKQSKLSISEVAEAAGYKDITAFSKAFKDKTGVSPKAYRESYK